MELAAVRADVREDYWMDSSECERKGRVRHVLWTWQDYRFRDRRVILEDEPL